MKWIVWNELYGMNCMEWIVWNELYEMNCMEWIVWNELYEMNCMKNDMMTKVTIKILGVIRPDILEDLFITPTIHNIKYNNMIIIW